MDISGTAWVADWPGSRTVPGSGEPAPTLEYSSYHMLPFIESLAVHYRFTVPSASELPSMHFEIEWTEGQGGILNGQKVGPDLMPPGSRIESIDLLMQVMVRDEWMADYLLPLDTIGLGPAPSVTFVDISDVAWDSVFVDIGEDETRLIYESGFRLSEPRILRVVFAHGPLDENQPSVSAEPNPGLDSPDLTVIIPNIDIWIGCCDGIGKRSAPAGDVIRTDTGERREGGRSGLTGRKKVNRGKERTGTGQTETDRTETDRTEPNNTKPAQSESDDSGDNGGGIDFGKLLDSVDDDDEEDRLFPAAIAAVALVGGLAIFGGTVGYFGSMSKAPIGLMSGYVERRGGVLFQAAINRQVFGKADGPENLILSLTGSYNFFDSPIQPAIGLGARLTEEETTDLVWKPSVSVGFVGNFGEFVLLAGYDVTTPDFRFGLGVNFRH